MNADLSELQGSGHRVLVIDDEEDIRDTLDVFLSLEGYEVATAESGEAAVQKAQREPFDLAITDLRMPGMGGDETVAALRRLNPSLPIIVVTGYASDESVVRCSKEGAFRIVSKPVQLDALLLLVQAALSGARA
ncbi:response regulator [Sorangium sp. So ce341]|uniref:response regulator n=1 Tax=Sorangium sp. So ce341 TaxID=3133302 RepID=UPI003F62E651